MHARLVAVSANVQKPFLKSSTRRHHRITQHYNNILCN